MKGGNTMKSIITKKDIEKSVKITKRGATVKSDDVAKVFGKTHFNVLKLIDKHIASLFQMEYSEMQISQYFIKDNYINSRGKLYRRFQLTRKGFDLVALSLTGKEAFQYKVWYIDEFFKKSDIIQKNKQIAYENSENPIWLEFREQGKAIRTKLTDAINDYLLPQRVEENKETSQFVARYITSYTKLIYKVLDIDTPIVDRDTMDLRLLFKIEQLEERVANLIEEYANEGIHYKDIYKRIKKELLNR